LPESPELPKSPELKTGALSTGAIDDCQDRRNCQTLPEFPPRQVFNPGNFWQSWQFWQSLLAGIDADQTQVQPRAKS
jgi:hypothetical protein